MIPTGGLHGTWNAVTSKQFWFVVIFSSIAALVFFGFLHYAEKEMTQEPTEQEKEEFWQRQAERRAENEVIVGGRKHERARNRSQTSPVKPRR